MPEAQNPKRRHHYVWRHYLRAWALNERIWCRADENIINPGLMGIAQERDFYRFQLLNDTDIDFVRSGIIDLAMPMLRELHLSSLKRYLLIQSGLLLARIHVGKDANLDKAVEAMECNFLEDWHGSVEESAIPHLDALLHEDTAFYQERGSCIEFAVYFATQHLRTQKHRDLVLDPGSPIPQDVRQRTWPLVVHLLATNVAWDLFASWQSRPLRLLHNETAVDFLTADQPVVNTLVDPGAARTPPECVCFYYPLSPRLGLVIGADPRLGDGDHVGTTVDQVQWLNHRMRRNAHRHVFARTRDQLANLPAE